MGVSAISQWYRNLIASLFVLVWSVAVYEFLRHLKAGAVAQQFRLTSGLVTLILSYSEDEVTTGSVIPRPTMGTGNTRRSCSTLLTVWSVTCWYENLINRALEWLK